MKIALFYNLAFGGAKRVVMEQARGLREKGHNVDLYTTNIEIDAFDPSPYCENVYSYTFSMQSSALFMKRFITDYKNFFALRKLHREIASDIDSRDYAIVLAHPDKLTQAPFVL